MWTSTFGRQPGEPLPWRDAAPDPWGDKLPPWDDKPVPYPGPGKALPFRAEPTPKRPDDGLLKPSRSILNASSTVKSMQLALQSLGNRVGDSLVATAADGIVGPNTLRAVNRAIPKYAPFAPPEFRTGKLTASKVSAYASEITSYLNRGGSNAKPAAAAVPTSAPAPTPAASFFQRMTTTPAAVPAAPGGAMNPTYYAPQPAYYPQPQGYYPQAPRAGGLPTDRATLDVKAFIPAQYQHVRLSPVTGLLIVGGGLALIALIVKNRRLAGK